MFYKVHQTISLAEKNRNQKTKVGTYLVSLLRAPHSGDTEVTCWKTSPKPRATVFQNHETEDPL